ncbi:MAG: hypothetical protein CBD77_01080 [bacterium TMED217]|nr:MAG: hypothetical protein CBD77_01080 [bacterium TMED217]|tara:strand:- start:621 stop:1241 length:621 start_codon:yes stop_codon:yes gene_type:complete
MQKTIYFLIFYFSIIFGDSSIHPMAKSLLFPGWGELDLGNKKSSRFFIQTEAILVASCLTAYKLGEVREKEYIAYANEYAGAKKTGDHRYWVDIGNYNSNEDFDEEHLRMRDGKEGQWAYSPWYWKSGDTTRRNFEKMRINSDKFFFTGRFIVGGIILNHIISGINSLYLSRINNKSNLSLVPKIKFQKYDVQYLFEFQLNINSNN